VDILITADMADILITADMAVTAVITAATDGAISLV
jgi:hypothetical protein